MGPSQSLRQRDIRFAYQLLGEVEELGSEPSTWRRHALTRLCERTGGRVGITLELNNFLPNTLPVSIDPVDIGFDSMNQRLLYVRYLQSNERAVDPSNLALTTVKPNRRFLTVRRHEILDDAQWYGSPVTSESRRGSNVDHYLCSLYRLRCPGSTTGFIFYKNWNESEFPERSRRLLQFFHLILLKRLFRNSGDQRLSDRLPPHLRQILRCILNGSNTKQTAASLGLSVHTVKSYSKELYQMLDVHSRGELLARFLKSPGQRLICMPVGLNI